MRHTSPLGMSWSMQSTKCRYSLPALYTYWRSRVFVFSIAGVKTDGHSNFLESGGPHPTWGQADKNDFGGGSVRTKKTDDP